jgi:hypothetical protein
MPHERMMAAQAAEVPDEKVFLFIENRYDSRMDYGVHHREDDVPLTCLVRRSRLPTAARRVVTDASKQGNANPVTRYFHGGNRGLKVGDYILPASATRRASASDFGAEKTHQKDRVYVSTNPSHAQFFASASRDPVVYEVEPEGELEPDPDCRTGVSFACSKAKIISVHKIPGKIIKKHKKAMRRA